MLYVVIRKRGHEVVAVVIVLLEAQADVLVIACLLGRREEVLGQQLALLVEVVTGSLRAALVLFTMSREI